MAMSAACQTLTVMMGVSRRARCSGPRAVLGKRRSQQQNERQAATEGRELPGTSFSSLCRPRGLLLWINARNGIGRSSTTIWISTRVPSCSSSRRSRISSGLAEIVLNTPPAGSCAHAAQVHDSIGTPA
jgi:hypothetical protein